MLSRLRVDRDPGAGRNDPPLEESSIMKKRRRKLMCARGDPMNFTQYQYNKELFYSLVCQDDRRNNLPTTEWDRLILNGARLQTFRGGIVKFLVEYPGNKHRGDPVEIIKYLLGQGVTMGYESLRHAVESGFYESVQVMCEIGGLDPAALLLCDRVKDGPSEPMCLEAMQLGIELGAHPDARDYGRIHSDKTPLARVLHPNYHDRVAFLISVGASPGPLADLTKVQRTMYEVFRLVEIQRAPKAMAAISKLKYAAKIKLDRSCKNALGIF